ncbi:hypothetical protein TIFTF001_033559 [Ficus carica]|uniref:Uncharacterized protein n=1 Tax=Ficus carica TaxID=3494 RepID=A0AA88DZ12_FICCA|nr:hypothetical protein TIFTF001_033559 [Ficus carica]
MSGLEQHGFGHSRQVFVGVADVIVVLAERKLTSYVDAIGHHSRTQESLVPKFGQRAGYREKGKRRNPSQGETGFLEACGRILEQLVTGL